MASSGYVADTFVAGEQPTTAKWNELWGNDASFNSGNGFNDGILVTRHFANSAVTPDKLATGAIKLGVATVTTQQSFNSNASDVDLTGLAVTVTVPTGGRDLLLLANGCFDSSTGSPALFILKVKEGTTVLGSTQMQQNSNIRSSLQAMVPVSAPSAGSHTYKCAIYVNQAGAQNSYADATSPAKLIALLI